MGKKKHFSLFTILFLFIGLGIFVVLFEQSRRITQGAAVGQEQQSGELPVALFAGDENVLVESLDQEKHSVPLEEIIAGGPPKDGIPSIDHPKYISIKQASVWLSPNDPGIAVSIGGTNRFYPFSILVWHEIVNDTLPNGQKILVSYCPLCQTGIVFDPLVNDERVEFGTSGKVWQSNLVMYDRKTESYWSQILGKAIAGEMTGATLDILHSQIVKFGSWSTHYPTGQVLSKETGATRDYGHDPYGDYYTTPGVYFPIAFEDDRLAEKDVVLGIILDGQSKAYHLARIQEKGEIEDSFQGKTIVGRYDSELDFVRLFEKKPDDTLVEINAISSFWFAWVAVHPETELYK